jgi:hypothetical protein
MVDESDTIAQLEDRIEQLEATIAKMLPGRRDAMKLGGAAVIGAAAMSGTASAGSSQVGTIGDGNNLVDIHAEDLFNVDTINGDQPVTSTESYAYQLEDDLTSASGDPVVIEFKTQ